MDGRARIFLTAFLGAILGLVLLASMHLPKGIYIAAPFLGLMLSFSVFYNEKIAYWLILSNIYMFGPLIGMHFPFIGTKIVWISDSILLVLAVKLFFELVRQKKDIFKDKENILIFVLLFLGVFSALVERVPQIVVVCGLRNYFKFIPLFFAMKYLSPGKKFVKKVFLFLIFIAIINIPLSVFQFLFYHDFDYVGGIFGVGGSAVLTVFQLLIIGYVLLLSKHGIIKRGQALFLSATLLSPIFINHTKISFFLLPLLLLYVYRDYIFRKIMHSISISLSAVVVFCFLISAYSTITEDFSLKEMLSYDYLYTYLYEMPYFSNPKSLNRVSAITFAYKNISKQPHTLLLGVGIGNASLSQLPGGMGSYYRKYFDLKIDFITLSRMLWEYGVVGSFLFFLLIVFLWRRAVFRIKNTHDLYLRSIAETFTLLVMFLAITFVYNLSFHTDQLGGLFWLLGGFLSQKGEVV